MRRLLFGHERPPRRVRLALFAFGLPALAGAYVTTESEAVQILVLFGLTFGALPALSHRYGVRNEFTEATSQRNVPTRVLAWSLVFGLPWGALTLSVVPESLGPWFLFWLVMLPWLEVWAYLAERALQRGGAESWPKTRPVRDSAVAGAVTGPIILAIALTAGTAAGEALATGAACGVIVFAIGLAVAWLQRSAAQSAG